MENIYTFNMLFGVHKYCLGRQLVDHPIARSLNFDEDKIIVEMTMNLIKPKNNKMTKGSRFEM